MGRKQRLHSFIQNQKRGRFITTNVGLVDHAKNQVNHQKNHGTEGRAKNENSAPGFEADAFKDAEVSDILPFPNKNP